MRPGSEVYSCASTGLRCLPCRASIVAKQDKLRAYDCRIIPVDIDQDEIAGQARKPVIRPHRQAVIDKNRVEVVARRDTQRATRLLTCRHGCFKFAAVLDLSNSISPMPEILHWLDRRLKKIFPALLTSACARLYSCQSFV